jgi:hypothetical protein
MPKWQKKFIFAQENQRINFKPKAQKLLAQDQSKI